MDFILCPVAKAIPIWNTFSCSNKWLPLRQTSLEAADKSSSHTF